MNSMFEPVTDRDRCLAVDRAADHFVAEAIRQVIVSQKIHPASAACAALASTMRLLGGMSEEGLHLMAEALLSGTCDAEKQERGMQALVDSYDQQIAQIERAEAGGPLQ